ncbi:hypothetical protein D7V80_25135 [Corallococcus sp. CA054B]|nr:hypothetical protein D7V80_25135 [Corallococcus sp. CA054B]
MVIFVCGAVCFFFLLKFSRDEQEFDCFLMFWRNSRAQSLQVRGFDSSCRQAGGFFCALFSLFGR